MREKGIDLLSHLGLSRLQSKVYFTLMETGETNARTLCDACNLPRTEVYRSLRELQHRGLIEKEVCSPIKFVTVPIDEALQILLNDRFFEFEEMNNRIKKFHEKYRGYIKNIPKSTIDYKITVIDGKYRILEKRAKLNGNCKNKICVLSTLPRLAQSLHYSLRDYEAALARGVKYRVIVEEPEKRKMPDELKSLLLISNFRLAFYPGHLRTDGAVYDGKELITVFFPARSLSSSPVLYTNHPSLIAMFEDHFEHIWDKSLECEALSEGIRT